MIICHFTGAATEEGAASEFHIVNNREYAISDSAGLKMTNDHCQISNDK